MKQILTGVALGWMMRAEVAVVIIFRTFVALALLATSVGPHGDEPPSPPRSRLAPVAPAVEGSAVTEPPKSARLPRIVPVDPFLTNLLMKPKIQYGGFAVEASRKGSNSFSRLFHWKEPGGFSVVSKNYAGDTSSGQARGFVVFSARFP